MNKCKNWLGLGLGVFFGGIVGTSITHFLNLNAYNLQGAVGLLCMFLGGYIGSKLISS